MDCVLEKVFNPARDWMRGRAGPRTAHHGRSIPYREFHLRKIAVGELALRALNDPHPAPSQELVHFPGVYCAFVRLPITPSFQWSPGKGPYSMPGTIASSQILRLPANFIGPQSPQRSASLRFPAL